MSISGGAIPGGRQCTSWFYGALGAGVDAWASAARAVLGAQEESVLAWLEGSREAYDRAYRFQAELFEQTRRGRERLWSAGSDTVTPVWAPPAHQSLGSVTLRDGTPIPYRPIRPADALSLQRFHERLSPDSVYGRHFRSMPELSEEQARRFTHVDGHDQYALVALQPDRPEEIIAVVRYSREPGTDRAEFAAVVEDRWQRRGLGLALTRRLAESARASGVRQLRSYMLPDGARRSSLLQSLGAPHRAGWEYGLRVIDVELGGPGRAPADSM